MNINYKQPQFELFPANSASLEDVNKPRFLLANLTLSIESLVILVILGIMVALFSFSLGVERGKHLTAQAIDERVAAAWNLAPRAPARAAIQPASTPVQAAVPVASKPLVITPHKAAGNRGVVTTNSSRSVKAPVARSAVVRTPVAKAPVVKAAVPVAAAAGAPAAAKQGRLTVQVGSYKNELYAKKEALSLKAKGLQGFLIKKGDFWLVCAGQFTTIEAAKSALKKIQLKYRGSSVRRF